MGGELARTMEPAWMRSYRADAAQQPQWRGRHGYREACQRLASAPPLVTDAELRELRAALRLVAEGDMHLLQAGDCAESFAETGEEQTRAKLTLLHRLADQLTGGTGQRVLRVGRLGGQFAKPRSTPVEHVDGLTLPAFRGHMVNSEVPTPDARGHDPFRMVRAYTASADVLGRVRADRAARVGVADGPADGPWASHDALVLDYEANLVRRARGRRFLASTHLPWIGDRTRHPDSPHVRLLADVANPVACKVGPSISVGHLRELCARLDPDRIPGRLILIARIGRDAIAELLPSLVRAVRSQGHPVIWLSDPMHGNTIRTRDGRKTRLLPDMVAEAQEFRRILLRHGAHPGGLHMEVATGDVTECVGGTVGCAEQVPTRYTTLCDPRLNPAQAAELIEGWLNA